MKPSEAATLITVSLSKLSEEEREELLKKIESDPDWSVKHVSFPKVNPNKASSPHYYEFTVVTALEKARKKVALRERIE